VKHTRCDLLDKDSTLRISSWCIITRDIVLSISAQIKRFVLTALAYHREEFVNSHLLECGIAPRTLYFPPLFKPLRVDGLGLYWFGVVYPSWKTSATATVVRSTSPTLRV